MQLGQGLFTKRRVIKRVEADHHGDTILKRKLLFRIEDSGGEEEQVSRLLGDRLTGCWIQGKEKHLTEPSHGTWLAAPRLPVNGSGCTTTWCLSVQEPFNCHAGAIQGHSLFRV